MLQREPSPVHLFATSGLLGKTTDSISLHSTNTPSPDRLRTPIPTPRGAVCVQKTARVHDDAVMSPRFPGSQEETVGAHWAPLLREGSPLQPPQPWCPQKESTDLIVQGAPPGLLCPLLGHVSPRKSLADETLTVSMYDGAAPLDDLMRKSFQLRGRPPAVRLGLTWCFEGILSFS